MTLLNVLCKIGSGLALAAALSSAAQAAAPQLISTSPRQQDAYGPFPKQLRLTFNEPVAASDLDIQLMDPDGRRIRLGPPLIAGGTVSLAPELSVSPPVSGPYMVAWRAKAQSGEGGEGSFSLFVQ